MNPGLLITGAIALAFAAPAAAVGNLARPARAPRPRPARTPQQARRVAKVNVSVLLFLLAVLVTIWIMS